MVQRKSDNTPRHGLLRLLGQALFGLFAVCLTASAVAAEPLTVVFAPFEGPRGSNVRREAYRAVEDKGHTVPDVDAVEARIDALDLDLSKHEGRVALAREFEAHAVVTGIVEDGRKMEVFITVYNGADGGVLGTARFRDREKKIKKVVRKGTWRELGDAIEKGAQPSPEVAEAPPPEKKKKKTQDSPPPAPTEGALAAGDAAAGDGAEVGLEARARPGAPVEPGAEGVTQPLEIAVGFRGFNRAFEYNDDLNRSLRPYTLDFGPAFNLDVAWFPGAHLTDGVGQWFGIVGNFHTAFAIDSATRDGDEAYPTSSLGWWAALRTRVPLGLSEIALDLGFGQERFEIDDAPSSERPLIPNVAYSAARAGLSSRIGLGWRNALHASLGYLLVLDAGEIASAAFFPHLDVDGLYASLGYSFAILPELELRLSADWSHYWFTMNPRPDDAIFTEHNSVAGGARDDYLGATFSVVYRFFQDTTDTSPAPAVNEPSPATNMY